MGGCGGSSLFAIISLMVLFLIAATYRKRKRVPAVVAAAEAARANVEGLMAVLEAHATPLPLIQAEFDPGYMDDDVALWAGLGAEDPEGVEDEEVREFVDRLYVQRDQALLREEARDVQQMINEVRGSVDAALQEAQVEDAERRGFVDGVYSQLVQEMRESVDAALQEAQAKRAEMAALIPELEAANTELKVLFDAFRAESAADRANLGTLLESSERELAAERANLGTLFEASEGQLAFFDEFKRASEQVYLAERADRADLVVGYERELLARDEQQAKYDEELAAREEQVDALRTALLDASASSQLEDISQLQETVGAMASELDQLRRDYNDAMAELNAARARIEATPAISESGGRVLFEDPAATLRPLNLVEALRETELENTAFGSPTDDRVYERAVVEALGSMGLAPLAQVAAEIRREEEEAAIADEMATRVLISGTPERPARAAAKQIPASERSTKPSQVSTRFLRSPKSRRPNVRLEDLPRPTP